MVLSSFTQRVWHHAWKPRGVGWPLSATPRLEKKRGIERATHPRLSFGRPLARSAVFARGKPGGARNPISRMCAGLTRLSHVRLRDLLIAGCTTSLPLIGRLIVSRFRCLFQLFDLSVSTLRNSPLFYFSSFLFSLFSFPFLSLFVSSSLSLFRLSRRPRVDAFAASRDTLQIGYLFLSAVKDIPQITVLIPF